MARPACRRLHDARHIARHCCSPSPPIVLPALPFLAPLPLVLPPLCSPRVYPGFGGCVVLWGWGGGLSDAGSGPLPRSFPSGGPMLALPVRV